MYTTWPYAIPNGPLDLYSLAIGPRTNGYDTVRTFWKPLSAVEMSK